MGKMRRFWLSKAGWFWLVNLSCFLFFTALPENHAKMLSVLVFALTGWGMGVLNPTVVSLLVIVLIPLFGLGSFQESLAGFSQPSVWLLFSTFVLAAAIDESGIGRRFALNILKHAKGQPRLTVLYVYLTVALSGLFIPTASGRAAMITPICTGMIQVVKDRPKTSHYGKNLLLGVAFVSSFMQWAVMTGSNASIYAVSTIERLTGFRWDYLGWFLFHFPLLVVLLFSLWAVLGRQHPLRKGETAVGSEFIREQLRSMGKFGKPEIKMAFIAVLTLAGWMTESYHGWDISYIALCAAVAACLPKIGVLSWDIAAKRVSWDAIILFAAGFALADTMLRGGTADWLAKLVTTSLPELSPFWAAFGMLVIILVLRLGYGNMLAITVTFLPVTVRLAEIWSINPVWLSQVVIIACSFGYFLPVQSPSNLITYSTGYFSQNDMLKSGAAISVISMMAVLATAFFYWPLLGMVP